MTSPTRSLNDGRTLPMIGLGTYGLRGDDGIASLNYENEREVGEGVREFGRLWDADPDTHEEF